MRLVAAAIVISRGRVLLARRKRGESHGGCWEFPGGAVEPGETVEECLARELREELGVAATIHEVIATNEERSGRDSMDLVALRARLGDAEFVLTAHDRIAWVSPCDIRRYRLTPADAAIAKILIERTDLFRE